MTPTADEARAMAERLRSRSFRLATRDFNGDGAKLALEAAAMLTALADDMERWVDPPRIQLGKV